MATIEAYQTSTGRKLCRVRYRTPDGKQTTKRGFVSKRDATAWRAQMQVSKQRGEYVSPSAGRVTVGSLATAWLGAKEATTRATHYRMLESAWRVHVEPVWGNVPVNRIDRLSVERWLAKMTVGGGGATTVKRCLGVLAGVLDDGVRGGYVAAANRARGVDGEKALGDGEQGVGARQFPR